MLELFTSITKQSLMITVFVIVMMLFIEYINVLTKNKWVNFFSKNKWAQIFIAALMGVIPGCLGTYTIVSLFTHNIFSLGALTTAMIATSGDEAFVMFGLIPTTAVKLSIIIFIIAVVAGFLTDIIFKKVKFKKTHDFKFETHKNEIFCECYNKSLFWTQLKNISFQRAIILFGIFVFSFGLLTNELGNLDKHNNKSKTEQTITNETPSNISSIVNLENNEEPHSFNWIKLTFLIITAFSLFIALTVPDHFLEKHLWGHVIKKHFLKIFLWTFGTLLFLSIIENYFDVSAWVNSNIYIVLIISVLIGIIPESGPHLIFVTMFFNGTLPFGILLANSIVQDGHGSLPLLAETKKGFVIVKLINIVVGLIAGFVAISI